MTFKSLFQAALLSVFYFTASVLAAFGYSSSGGNYIIDAGSSNSLVFSVSQSSCDINSIVYRGVELQYSGKGTHIASGLGSASVSITTIDSSYIKVTCVTSTLTQYMVVRSGDSTIHMATYITAEPSVGELRFIARLLPSVLPYEYPHGVVSTTTGSSSTVEGSDVFVVDGETRSKFYSSDRFIDQDAWCVWGDSVDTIHVCVMAPRQESSSGGPFFRDINTNNAGDSTNLFNYMNSGHVQTEDYRMGLHGPYMMQFSRSGIPTASGYDLGFWEGLGITGYVNEAARGTVAGTASGVASGFEIVLHWFNSEAQYWTKASSSGAFTSPKMKPGTYTMALYQTEYKVAETSVSVSAGSTTTKNMASGLESMNVIFQIGDLDGQPTGLRNADKFLRMHPSDSRMSSWSPGTYTVGGSSASDFPMAIFKEVNNPATISFSLDSDPGAATLRVATTLSFAGARPQLVVNSLAGSIPSAPTKIDSRGVTRGAYRGYGDVYDLSIPAGTLNSGSNTITITAVSGSSGDSYLSPNFIVDSVILFTAGSGGSGSGGGSTTTTTTTSASGPTETSSDCAAMWGQCGGSGYAGSTCCAEGTCTYSNEWYSQCL
ncbi:polysaccharide lyase family 4 protein [Zalerion maritima]|uniref:rhamnogalacturonan endolyase n=1 Tax=Zalerion maritima TaxID=339359 RepID=A0AAD5WPU0_9PEZI|nr:polysaccharide lyase family 4 protein [Zalerion maritima]